MQSEPHTLPNGLEVLTLSSATPDNSRYASQMVARAHLLLPEYADGWGEELRHWQERIATGKVAEKSEVTGSEYYLPELNITIVGTNLRDPNNAVIKGFAYGEYHDVEYRDGVRHEKSKTAHIPYHAISDKMDKAVAPALKEHIKNALSKNGSRELNGVFEELPEGIKPLFGLSGSKVNFSAYATTPWYDYGSKQMSAPLENFNLYAASLTQEKSITPKVLESFLEDHHQYNSSHSFSQNVAAYPGTLGLMDQEIQKMKSDDLPVLLPSKVSTRGVA